MPTLLPLLHPTEVLVVTNDPYLLASLRDRLQEWGLPTSTTRDGEAAFALLRRARAPRLVLVDEVLPGRSGQELCLASGGCAPSCRPTSSSCARSHALAGSAVDDCMPCPPEGDELRDRIRLGLRILHLQGELAEARREPALITACSYCQRIHDTERGWLPPAEFLVHQPTTHGACPSCYEEVARPELEALRERLERESSP